MQMSAFYMTAFDQKKLFPDVTREGGAVLSCAIETERKGRLSFLYVPFYRSLSTLRTAVGSITDVPSKCSPNASSCAREWFMALLSPPPSHESVR